MSTLERKPLSERIASFTKKKEIRPGYVPTLNEYRDWHKQVLDLEAALSKDRELLQQACDALANCRHRIGCGAYNRQNDGDAYLVDRDCTCGKTAALSSLASIGITPTSK